jgi:predicted aldo/keto reductase-like oxidoreductase
MQFNNFFCLRHEQVHTLSIGAARPSDLDEHVEGLRYWDQRDGLTREIEARLEAALIEAHGADWVTHWHKGLPKWEDVPGHINIHEILRLWTYGAGLDLIGWAKMRYNLLGQGDHWFPGRNAAEFKVAELDALLAGSPFRYEIPGILWTAHQRFFEAPVKRASEGG